MFSHFLLLLCTLWELCARFLIDIMLFTDQKKKSLSISRLWKNRDKFILKGRHSSTIRRYIHTELFQIGDGGYYPVETPNIISVQFLYLIPESVASFLGPNII